MRTFTLAVAALALGAVPSFAETPEFPQRKAGQWNIEMNMEGAPPMTAQMCIDEETDAAMMQAGLSMSKDMCPELDIQQDGDTMTVKSTCNVGAMTTRSEVVMTGDYQAQYTVEVNGEIEGAPANMPTTTAMKQTVTWVGECSDLKPGEMSMPGGVKVNVNDMLKSMGG